MSLIGLMAWAIIVGFIGYVAVRVLPTVNEFFTVQRAVDRVAADSPPTVGEVRKAFDKQKDIEYSITQHLRQGPRGHQGERQAGHPLCLRQGNPAGRAGVPAVEVQRAFQIDWNMTEASLDALQQRLGHVFAQPALLTRALTHRSFRHRAQRAAGVPGRRGAEHGRVGAAVPALRRLGRRRPDARARAPGARGKPAPCRAGAGPAAGAAPVRRRNARRRRAACVDPGRRAGGADRRRLPRWRLRRRRSRWCAACSAS